MKRLLFPVLLLAPALFLAICLNPGSLSADEFPLLDADELYIGFVSLEKGLACGTDAEYISGIHKNQNAPLNPSLASPPNKNSNALLGLVIQILGGNNVCRNLVFELTLRFETIENQYKGSWESSSTKCPSIAHAHTTDWWINLSDLFSPDDINNICNDKQNFSVRLISHKFLPN